MNRGIDDLYKARMCVYGKKLINEKTDENKEHNRLLDIAISCIDSQLTNGWIPCSSGELPDFNDVCDITRNGVVIEDVIYQGINDGEDTWYICSGNGDYKYVVVYSAIAWRKHIIPEPYKEVSYEA